MTGGEAYKQKLINDDMLHAAAVAYLAEPEGPLTIEFGDRRIDVLAAIKAQPYALEVLAREDATSAQKAHAVRTAILLAPVG